MNKISPKSDDTTHPSESTPLNGHRIIRKSKKDDCKKWIVLSLCCSVMFGLYYILAMPAALHQQLYQVMPSGNFEMNFNLLFTVSYFPNMVLPLFGGAVVDWYGEAICLVIFSVVIVCGQILTALGVTTTSWWWMLLGRFIFGIGAQNLIVTNAALISRWFTGKELGVALGLSNVLSYTGVIFTNIASPFIANYVSTQSAFWVGVAVKSLAFMLTLVIVFIDRGSSKRGKGGGRNTPMCSPMFSPASFVDESPCISKELIKIQKEKENNSTNEDDQSEFRLSDISKFSKSFWLLCLSFLLVYGIVWGFTNVASALLLERDFFMETPETCTLKYPDQCISGYLAPEDGNPSTDMFGNSCPGDNFSPVIPTSLHVTDGNQKYMFESLDASDINCNDAFWAEACMQDYCDDLALATQKSGVYMSIPYFFTVACTFHLGLLLDRTGWRAEMIFLGPVLLVLAHFLLAFRTSPPAIGLIAQGLGYTISVAALWPSVPFTVDENAVGTAFGIMMCVQNVGLALIPLVVAWLFRVADNHYIPAVELFFAVCASLAVLVGAVLIVADRTTHDLHSPDGKVSKEKGVESEDYRPLIRSASFT